MVSVNVDYKKGSLTSERVLAFPQIPNKGDIITMNTRLGYTSYKILYIDYKFDGSIFDRVVIFVEQED